MAKAAINSFTIILSQVHQPYSMIISFYHFKESYNDTRIRGLQGVKANENKMIENRMDLGKDK